MIKVNSLICVYLQNPREKFWGRLYELDQRGIQFIGVDFKSFDDWCHELGRGEEATIYSSNLFIPANRIEKIVLDEDQGAYQSFAERFRQRTGQEVVKHLPLSDTD